MSLRIRTLVSGVHKYLDLFDDEDILMSFSVGEIQDITSKNSGYSKSFTLPGTKNNNEIFNYYYDVNSTPLDFNPNDKFDAIISWDGYEILVGNIRLDGVSIQGEDYTYQVTFYNQIGNLSANIGDKFLRQTDLSHLSHPFSDEVIYQSNIDYNLFPITAYTNTNYSYQNGKTMWGLYNIGYSYSGNSPSIQSEITPLVEFTPLSGLTYTPQFGYFDFNQTPVNDYYFKPTLQIKELYSSIVRDAGYEIQSDFFDTSYFERFYLPLKFLDETVYSRNALIPCYTYENEGFFFSTSPQSASTNPISGVTCNTLNLSATTEFINIPTFFEGQYTFNFSYTAQRNLFTGCEFTIVNNGPGNLQYEYINSSGVVSIGFIPSADIGLPYTELGSFNGIISGNGTVTNESSSDVSLFYNDYTNTQVIREDGLCINETSTIQVEFTKDFIFTGDTDIQFYFFGTNATVSDFKFKIFNGPRFLVSGQTIDYALEFPDNDYKQIDFITSINRYFNLVVVPSPDKSNTLIIEPIVDYFGKGELLDWSTKVDYNQLQSLSPTTSLINGTLQFNFQLDQDYANQDFKTSSNKVFGTDKINLNIPYKNSATNFDFIFSSPIDITINSVQSNYLTLSSFSKVKTLDVTGSTLQQFNPFKILPRVVFRGLTLPVENYGIPPSVSGDVPIPQIWYFKSLGSTFSQLRFTNINRFTTYPFNYSGFSHYINFNGNDLTTIQPREFEFVAEDLYDIYYKDYIDDLISPENKIYKVKIYLTPNEVKSLLFNEKVLIKNSLFRINKIDNFNLLEPSICDLELVKLTKTYNPHRVIYINLIPCEGGEIRYSNSDLNFNLYAFIGNYVTLYDDDLNYLGCHQVVQGCYSESYDYQHYYLDDMLTGQPLSDSGYEDCECAIIRAFDVVQDGSLVPPCVSPSPTPTPTSTNTATNTPTPTNTGTPTNTPTNTPTPSSTPAPIGAWSVGGSLSIARYTLAGAGTQNAGLAFGGSNGYPNTAGSCTEEYDGTSWSAGGGLITARGQLAGAGTQNAGLAFGGGYLLSCTEEYNGSSWSAGGALITARQQLAGTGEQNAGLAFGGIATPFTIVSCTEEYNGSSWSTGGAIITARHGLAGAGTQNEALAFGGRAFSPIDISSCTEEYNGTSWSTGGSLSIARYSLAGAGTQNAGLAFGGSNIQRCSCTEEYNGTSWSTGGALIISRCNLGGAGTQSAGLGFGGSTGIVVSCTEEYSS